MDAETRRTLAATVLSTLVRVSFVFLALRQYDRENGASAQKNKRENERGTRERGGRRGRGRENEIISDTFNKRKKCSNNSQSVIEHIT